MEKVIGKNVTIYQQATLGGITPSVDSESQRNIKRHPTIKDNDRLWFQILGSLYRRKCFKRCSREHYIRGVSSKKLKQRKDTFNAYGIWGKIDDPNKKSIHVLFKEIHFLSEKIEKLKEELYKNTDFKNAYNVENSKKNKVAK